MRFPEYLQTPDGTYAGASIISEWTRTREDPLDWILSARTPSTDGLSYLITKHIPEDCRIGAFEEMQTRLEIWRVSWQDTYQRLITQIATMSDYQCEHCGHVLSVLWDDDVESLVISCRNCNYVLEEVGG